MEQFFIKLSVDLLVQAAGSFGVRAFSGSVEVDPPTFTEGGTGVWANSLLVFRDTDRVDRLEFAPAAPGSVFGMDNLNIELSQTTTDNPVPEPASYALVGLALLAAGGASRKRKA